MPFPLASVATSNMPAAHKSQLAQFYERTMSRANSAGYGSTLDRVKAHAMQSGGALRQSGESILVGSALAMVHVHMTNGLDFQKKIPIDAVVGVTGVVSSVLLANEDVAQDLCNAGSAALSIFAFRKTFDWAAKKKGSSGGAKTSMGSDSDDINDYGAEEEDPIIALAKSL